MKIFDTTWDYWIVLFQIAFVCLLQAPYLVTVQHEIASISFIPSISQAIFCNTSSEVEDVQPSSLNFIISCSLTLYSLPVSLLVPFVSKQVPAISWWCHYDVFMLARLCNWNIFLMNTNDRPKIVGRKNIQQNYIFHSYTKCGVYSMWFISFLDRLFKFHPKLPCSCTTLKLRFIYENKAQRSYQRLCGAISWC